MANFLLVAGKVICVILVTLLVVMICKTTEYFNTLPENDKNRPVLACNVLTLIFMLIYLVLRLILA